MALSVYGLMVLLGVNTISGLQKVVNSYGWVAYLIIVALQIVQVVFIPISNQIITIPALAVIGVFPAFICSWIGIEIGTIILYFIGKKGGGKLFNWVLGDSDKVDKYTNLIKTRKLFYPVAMLIPFIPNDLCTVVAGMAKMNFWYIMVISFFTRGICTLFTCVGFGILTRYWWGIVILVVGLLLLLGCAYITLRYGDKIEDKIFRRKKNEIETKKDNA